MQRRPVHLITSLTTHGFLILVVFITIAPLVMIWLSSLKTNAELTINPVGLPRSWRFMNFVEAWNTARLGRHFLNSVFTTLPALVVVLVCASLAGYALAVMKFDAREPIFAIFLLGLMIPSISVVVPLYYTVLDLGLLDNRFGLILSEVAMALPLAIFVMRSAFLDLPDEIREAVFVDGGSEFDALWQVMLPLARPALTTVSVLVFLQVWNSFLYPLALINSESLRTVPLALAFMQGRYLRNTVLLAAATSLASLPTILIYIVFQRQFIRGIVEGAIK